MSDALNIIKDETLTYHQELIALARLGESTDDTLTYSDEYYAGKAKGALCDLNEGRMPYRPRYICPDYDLLFKKGCEFLELEPPKDLLEAVNALEIFYAHVPSITTYPVYLGDLDKLLEPFVIKEDRAYAKKVLGLFLKQIDKVLTDSFVHADIGPEDTVTGRLLLELTEEMQLAIPNLTLKYDPERTSDDFALACVKCMLRTAKPSFANHRMFVSEWGEDYAIASCYNGLKKAGGGFTLPRLRLYECSLDAKSVDDFFERELPKYIDLQLEYMDKRVKFIVEESTFFTHNFLATEGFVRQENFIGMFGLVGLAQCCNHLLGITDEKKGFARTYLVKDTVTRELAGYFSLRTGLITIRSEGDKFNTLPAAELSNFAVNSQYKVRHPEVAGLGKYMFKSFIIPLVRKMANYIGIHSLYIYALPEERLIEHYTTMGFSRLPPKQEKFVQRHVKPTYDEGCIFMYQVL